jgi:hypothetical protein
MLPAEQTIPPSIKVATSILLVAPSLIGCGARSVSRKYRLIVDRSSESNVQLRKEPPTDEVQSYNLLLWKLRQSSKIVVDLFIGLLRFVVPRGITNLENLLVKEADLPY